MWTGGKALPVIGMGAAYEDEERRLWAAAVAGDDSAFEAVSRRHWSQVASVCRRLLRNPEDVEDAVQETFLRAYRSRHRFRGEAGVRTWLMRIAVNFCRSQQRTFWRQRIWVSGEAGLHEAEAADATLAVESELLRAEVFTVLRELPERLSLPYVLHVFEELSGAEIAAVLEWNESTVWSRIYAARRHLRKRLAAYLD
jgi:RNA polymerase sigma-70 factor (ECF subfamily)